MTRGPSDLPVDLPGFRAAMAEVGIEEMVEPTLQIYLEEGEEIMARLQEAAAVPDMEAIRASAHSLKSSSRSIHANELADMLQALELAAQDGDHEAAQRLAPSVSSEFAEVVKHIEAGLGA